ncbi:MAG: hypothetical protein KBB86_01085 [Candidatus Pacebacteria bacterium]|nr:hypothetical protein [Candidatus Paceibacterota bacterium]
MDIKGIKKAPHYFLVHFNETFTCVNGADRTGKAYIIVCDNVPTNVYGFKSEEEAKSFNPLKLRRLMRGCKNTKLLWDAKNEEELMQSLNNDPRIKSGVFVLNHEHPRGAIEDLPKCKRMYKKPDESLLCGKPINSNGDGCCGGCMLEGYDQDEPFGDFMCPMYPFFKKNPKVKKKKLFTRLMRTVKE